jgi:hypothetical protein
MCVCMLMLTHAHSFHSYHSRMSRVISHRRDEDGLTILDYAVMLNDSKCVQLIQECGGSENNQRTSNSKLIVTDDQSSKKKLLSSCADLDPTSREIRIEELLVEKKVRGNSRQCYPRITSRVKTPCVHYFYYLLRQSYRQLKMS